MDRQHAKSVGDLTLEQGMYGSVSSAGDLHIVGDVDILDLKAAGDVDAKEKVLCERLRVYGEGTFRQGLTFGEAKIYGDGKIMGPFQGDVLKVYGALSFETLTVEELTVYGAIEKAMEVNAEKASFSGEVKIKESLNVGTGTFQLVGNSKIKEIYAEKLEVLSEGDLFQGILSGLVSSGKRGTLEAELIEGDYIELENTKAKVLRGKVLRVGKGSVIERAEYSERLEVHEEAKILVKVQL